MSKALSVFTVTSIACVTTWALPPCQMSGISLSGANPTVKCTREEPRLQAPHDNLPETILPSRWKNCLPETGPWCQKVGNRCSKLLQLDSLS